MTQKFSEMFFFERKYDLIAETFWTQFNLDCGLFALVPRALINFKFGIVGVSKQRGLSARIRFRAGTEQHIHIDTFWDITSLASQIQYRLRTLIGNQREEFEIKTAKFQLPIINLKLVLDNKNNACGLEFSWNEIRFSLLAHENFNCFQMSTKHVQYY